MQQGTVTRLSNNYIQLYNFLLKYCQTTAIRDRLYAGERLGEWPRPKGSMARLRLMAPVGAPGPALYVDKWRIT